MGLIFDLHYSYMLAFDMKTITEKTSKILDYLVPQGDLDTKIRKIVIEDLKRKLAEFQLIDHRFQKKYGMTLDEFEKKNIIKEKGFSFEVESDYHEWDSAVDAIKTIKTYLDELMRG
jgi:polyhydroxyalkanoate synthesis regulator phasin